MQIKKHKQMSNQRDFCPIQLKAFRSVECVQHWAAYQNVVPTGQNSNAFLVIKHIDYLA